MSKWRTIGTLEAVDEPSVCLNDQRRVFDGSAPPLFVLATDIHECRDRGEGDVSRDSSIS
jgi:hypothetical protein